MAGFSVGVAADTRAFETAVKSGIIDPLDDAQDALLDLGKSGEKAGDGLSKSTQDAEQSLSKLGREAKDAGNDVERGMKDAERSTDKLGQAGKEAGDDLERGLKDAQRQTSQTSDDFRDMARKIQADSEKIKASSREAFDKSASTTGEFKEEALSNFSEVTSSFQGDMTSITDLAQGTFGGLASMGGPASLAFGGIAVAVGLIGSALAESGEDTEEFKQKIKDLAETKLGDLFSQWEDSGDDLSRGLRKWATDADSYGGSLTDLQKNLRKAGVESGNYVDSIATQSVPAMRGARKEIEAQIKSLDKQASAQRGAGNGASALANKFGEQSDAARAVKKQLDDNLKVSDEYEKSLRAVAKASGQTVEQYKASAEAAADMQAANESLADSMKSLAADSAESTAEVLDNSAMSAEKYIRDTRKRQAADAEYYSNLSAVGKNVPDDVLNYLKTQGESFSQELATYLAATPEQQAAILETWKTAAGAGTDIDGPTVKAKGDTSDVDKKTDAKSKETKAGPTSKLKADAKDVDKATAAKGREKKDGPTLKFGVDDDAVKKALARYKNRTVAGPTIKFGVDTSAVDTAAARIRNNPITQTVNQQLGKRVA